MIWNALICKYICQNKDRNFSQSEFLSNVIEDKVVPIGAYNKEMLKKTNAGEKNEFYHLIKYCLEFLRSSRLLDLTYEGNQGYLATDRLMAICPQVARIIMPMIEPVLDAEREVRTYPNYKNIVSFLDHLEKSKETTKNGAIKYVTTNDLHNLIRLGVITLYVNGKITITTVGQLLKPLLV